MRGHLILSLALTLTLNPNFGESGFDETGFGESERHRISAIISVYTNCWSLYTYINDNRYPGSRIPGP